MIRLERVHIITIYAICAGLWIVLSDAYVAPVLPGGQTVKGLFFVGVTSLLLYVLLGARRRASQQETLSEIDKLTESVGIGLALVDRREGVVLWTRSAESLTGMSAERILGSTPDELADALGVAPETFTRGAGTDDVTTVSGLQPNTRMLQVSLAAGDDGMTLLTIEDETEREQLIRELESIQQRYMRAEEIGSMGHWVNNLGDVTLSWSPQIYRIFGVEPDEFDVSPSSFRDVVHPDDLAELQEVVAGATERGDGFDHIHRIVTGDDRVRWVREVGTVEVDDEGVATEIRGTVQDITDSVRAERKRRASADRIQRLVQDITVAQEEERARLSREIHDELGQVLTGLTFGLRALRGSLDQEGRDTLEQLEGEVREATRFVGRLAARLRPPLLDQFGLRASLEGLCEKARGSFGLTCEFHGDPPDHELDVGHAIQVYRIIQEALTNVGKHSNADRVEVRLDDSDGSLCVVVRDDGDGFDVDAERSDTSLGIQGMVERAELIGATLNIESAESGTTVRVSIPRPEREQGTP